MRAAPAHAADAGCRRTSARPGPSRTRAVARRPAPGVQGKALEEGAAPGPLERLEVPGSLLDSSAQVLLEEVHGALPGQVRRRLVVARGGVVVEAVLRARI